jgi:hypothetical protein
MLARDLGMTVGQMMNTISSRELTEWIAFYTLEREEQEAAQRRAQQQAKMRSR